MNVSEIESDPALVRYGAALSFAYVVSSVYMFVGDHFAAMMAPGHEAVCWPFFESCGDYRIFSPLALRLIVLGFGIVSLAATGAFLRGKARLGYWLLLASAAWHVALMAQDFRNTQNQYYMLMWAVGAYLFWPEKRATLHYLILSFYFWAGRLKLNPQWLSGQGLYTKLFLIPDSLRPEACIYVVFLEMAMIWGLVSRNRRWFWATLAQLLAFHIVSFSQIGAYYPVLMICILAIYPLSRWIPMGQPEFRAGWRRLPKLAAAPVALFAFFQIYPSLMSHDRALSGVGRTFALNMFEARYDCDVRWVEHDQAGHETTAEIREKLSDRLNCEPIYYYEKTLNHCRARKSDPSFRDLNFQMDLARTGTLPLRPLFRISNFCSQPPPFHLFLPNSWIID